MPTSLDLTNLHAGFVNSFNGLMLMAGNWAEGRCDPATSTHAIIDWFRRTGVAQGFYPVCERQQRDLEWFSVGDPVPVLHLESENFYGKLDHTLDKLLGSDALARVGLVWTDKSPAELESLFARARQATTGASWSMLLIVRRSPVTPTTEDLRHGRVYHYPIEGHLFSNGEHRRLWPAYLEWPEKWGHITARWEPQDG